MKNIFIVFILLILHVSCGLSSNGKEKNNKARKNFNKAKINFLAMQNTFSQEKILLNKRVAKFPFKQKLVLLEAIDNFLNDVITQEQFLVVNGNIDVTAFINAKEQLQNTQNDFNAAQNNITEYVYLKKVKCVSLYDNINFCSNNFGYCNCVNNCRAKFASLGYNTLGDCYSACSNQFGTEKWWYCNSCLTSLVEFNSLNCLSVLQN